MMGSQTQLASLAVEEREENHDYKYAIKLLTTGIRIDPNNHDLYFERSICHYKLGDCQASLDDANTAIRLNSNHHNIHYQKALALIGLSMFSDAVTSFKKAIELRARQEDSKLSDIFKLLRDATNELNTARRKPGLVNNHQARSAPAPAPTQVNQVNAVPSAVQGTSGRDPVDSTTDRPIIHQSLAGQHQSVTSIDCGLIKEHSNNGNLVATNRNNDILNNQRNANLSGAFNNLPVGGTRVSSSASHMSGHHSMGQANISPEISSINSERGQMHHVNPDPHHQLDQSKSGAFDWNIRRSERIFLHSTEPGTSISHNNSLPGQAMDQTGVGLLHHQQSRSRTGSNPSSISSGRGATKRLQDSTESQSYQAKKMIISKESESDVDVDDSNNSPANHNNNSLQLTDTMVTQKRVLITPSSSMPATCQESATPPARDDSYSSKYKRLRRDRERARRGTSKLCTIKPSDLEELLKSSNSDSGRRFMRVIAPIDGWLYSGQLTIDDSCTDTTSPQYVVKLDGDTTGSSYLFNQETVLNDVIKEVKVKSVSELRKGARICCYWSRQYKCLSTGVVTSRTFEATKSLVSVKYDNGDLSALPLEDLRLLPPDYPKYMSNCDPLLLARNGDGGSSTNTAVIITNPHTANQPASRVIVENNSPQSDSRQSNGLGIQSAEVVEGKRYEHSNIIECRTEQTEPHQRANLTEGANGVRCEFIAEEDDEESEGKGMKPADLDDDATIPPTDEIIDFITSENDHLTSHEKNLRDSGDCVGQSLMTKGDMTIVETQLTGANNSRASSEENNFSMEFCPWMFDGPPRRNKRHGRTYRDNYTVIRRGSEVIRVGDSAELMPRDESILPFIAKIDGFWATGRGEMKVRVRWYYRLIETEGEPYELRDGENALFETDHFDENDVQSIYRSTKILSWSEYSRNHLGHVNKSNERTPKIFYLAGYYDPVRRVKHLQSDVKETQ